MYIKSYYRDIRSFTSTKINKSSSMAFRVETANLLYKVADFVKEY